MVFQVVSYWLKLKEPTSKSQFPLSRLWDFFGRIIFHQAAVFITKPPVSSKAAQLVVSFTCSTDDAGRRKRQSLINYKFCSGFFFYEQFFCMSISNNDDCLSKHRKTINYEIFSFLAMNSEKKLKLQRLYAIWTWSKWRKVKLRTF